MAMKKTLEKRPDLMEDSNEWICFKNK
jgi:hypothetical protein